MNKYSLSSPSDRIASTAISSLLTVLMIFLVFILRGDLLSLIIAALAAVLIAAVLIFYVVSLQKAACFPLAVEKKLHVLGLPDYTVDLAQAASVQTVAYNNGGLATRTLVFSDSQDEVIASVPTFFFSRQGAMAEPVAKEIAREMGLTFIPTLEPWEYDAALRREHEKEVALAEKEARKARFQALKNKILRRGSAEKPAATAPEEENVDYFEGESDGINYDAMDDEK